MFYIAAYILKKTKQKKRNVAIPKSYITTTIIKENSEKKKEKKKYFQVTVSIMTFIELHIGTGTLVIYCWLGIMHNTYVYCKSSC